MDDERTLPGVPVLDRQERPLRLDSSGRPLVPGRVPEIRPTPLQEVFIPLSVVALICGVVAITALNLGAALSDPLVRVPMLVSAVVLAVVTVDALVRVWRSVWAWLPVDRGRALFRLVWVAALTIILGLLAVAALVVLAA
jgi:hypothetical protein